MLEPGGLHLLNAFIWTLAGCRCWSELPGRKMHFYRALLLCLPVSQLQCCFCGALSLLCPHGDAAVINPYSSNFFHIKPN